MSALAIATSSCATSARCASEAADEPEVASASDPVPGQAPEMESGERVVAGSEGDALPAPGVEVSDEKLERSVGSSPELVREHAMDPSRPLPASVFDALSEVAFDPHPEALTRDSHYWVSNEHHHHLFRPSVERHGGIYLGVGTDQNYLMAAWAKSPIAIMMDFDQQIRHVHLIYEVMFRRAETPREFIAHWAPPRADDVVAWLEEEYGEGAKLAALTRTFRTARQTIFWRLRELARVYDERGIPTFVTDQSQYEFIRDLWRYGRILPIRGDLTADRTMVEIAATLESFGLHLGLMYTSNAEQYFEFSPAFRRNIIAQPFSDDALILRTRSMRALGYAEDGEYHYNVQPGKRFAQWMAKSRIPNAARLLLRYREDAGTQGLSFLRREPEASAHPPEVADLVPEAP